MKKTLLSIVLLSTLNLFGVSFWIRNNTETDIFNPNLNGKPPSKNLTPAKRLKPEYQYQKTEATEEEDRSQTGEIVLSFAHFTKGNKPLEYHGPNLAVIPLTRMPLENEKFEIVENPLAQKGQNQAQFIIKPVFEPSLKERIAMVIRGNPELTRETKQTIPALIQEQQAIGYGAEGKTLEEIEALQNPQ